MEKEIKEKFNSLCLYLYKQNKFQKQFFTALENSLFDFCIILLWKTLMLYIYEKFQQIRELKENVFIEKWKVRFKEDKLRNYPKQNLYCFNKEKDDDMISFLTIIYPLDTNYVSKLNTLKSNRDIASHVCDDGLEFKIKQVSSYLDDLLMVIGILENLHLDNYLKEFKEPSELLNRKPSIVEKRSSLEQLISKLNNSLTFNQAQETIDNILQFLDCIIPKHIESILEAVYQDGFPLPINQVLEASGGNFASKFLEKIFKLGQNKYVDIKKWEDFYGKLSKQQYLNVNQAGMLGLYNWLAKELKPSKNEEEIGEDIPF